MIKRILVSTLLLTVIIPVLLLFSGCGGSLAPSLTEQQKAVKTMVEGSPWGGTGKVEVIEVPTGVDPSGLSSLSIVFGSSGEPEWEPTTIEAFGADEFLSTSNSTWSWGSAGTTIITLTNASSSELTAVDVTDQVLTFTFEINSGGGAGSRVKGLDGSYTVKLLRNDS
jgi:hypothetical protein